MASRVPLARLFRGGCGGPPAVAAPSAGARLMSIMGAYRSGSVDEKTAAIKRLLEQQAAAQQKQQRAGARPAAVAPPPSPPSRTPRDSAHPAFTSTTTSDASAASSSATSDEGAAAPPSALAVVETSPAHAAPPPPPLPAPPSRADVMAAVVADLAERGRLHRATMEAIESTQEWQGYDAQVTFELMLLRHRYVSTDAPMNAARRSQMQAHLRAKQRQVMEEHAERLAEEFVGSLTAAERAAFRAEFLRLDASPHVLGDGPPPSPPGLTLEQMQAALTEVTSKLRDPAFRQGWDTAVHHITAADLAGAGGRRGGGGGGAAGGSSTA